MPVIGFVGTSTANVPPLIGFRRGLAEAGFVEGRNVAVEYRFSEGRYERLPELVADLLGRNVAVLFAQARERHRSSVCQRQRPAAVRAGREPQSAGWQHHRRELFHGNAGG
jgi:hypothetical protein